MDYIVFLWFDIISCLQCYNNKVAAEFDYFKAWKLFAFNDMLKAEDICHCSDLWFMIPNSKPTGKENVPRKASHNQLLNNISAETAMDDVKKQTGLNIILGCWQENTLT